MLRNGLSEVAQKLSELTLESPSKHIEEIGPRFNIAPEQNSLILRPSLSKTKHLQPALMQWGLVPSWSKNGETQTPITELPAESIDLAPPFTATYRRRRCLIPADGFYTWDESENAPAPSYFRARYDSVFFMAGVWETWLGEDHQSLVSFAILTTRANSLVAEFQERMPLILKDEQIQPWLDADPRQIDANTFFEPIDSASLQRFPANPSVIDPEFEGPNCIESLQPCATAAEDENEEDSAPKFRSSILLQSKLS